MSNVWDRTKKLVCPICNFEAEIKSYPDSRNELTSIFEVRCTKCRNVWEKFFKLVKLIIIQDGLLALEVDHGLLKLPGRKLEIAETPDTAVSQICQEHHTYMNQKQFFKSVNAVGLRIYLFRVEIDNGQEFQFYRKEMIGKLIKANKVRDREVFMLDLIREAFL